MTDALKWTQVSDVSAVAQVRPAQRQPVLLLNLFFDFRFVLVDYPIYASQYINHQLMINLQALDAVAPLDIWAPQNNIVDPLSRLESTGIEPPQQPYIEQ